MSTLLLLISLSTNCEDEDDKCYKYKVEFESYLQASVCDVTIELGKLSEDCTKSAKYKVQKLKLESISGSVSTKLKLYAVTIQTNAKLEYSINIRVKPLLVIASLMLAKDKKITYKGGLI